MSKGDGEFLGVEIKSTGQLIAESQRVYLSAPGREGKLSELYHQYRLAVAGRVLCSGAEDASISIRMMQTQRQIRTLLSSGIYFGGLTAGNFAKLMQLVHELGEQIAEIDEAFGDERSPTPAPLPPDLLGCRTD